MFKKIIISVDQKNKRYIISKTNEKDFIKDKKKIFDKLLKKLNLSLKIRKIIFIISFIIFLFSIISFILLLIFKLYYLIITSFILFFLSVVIAVNNIRDEQRLKIDNDHIFDDFRFDFKLFYKIKDCTIFKTRQITKLSGRRKTFLSTPVQIWYDSVYEFLPVFQKDTLKQIKYNKFEVNEDVFITDKTI